MPLGEEDRKEECERETKRPQLQPVHQADGKAGGGSDCVTNRYHMAIPSCDVPQYHPRTTRQGLTREGNRIESVVPTVWNWGNCEVYMRETFLQGEAK
jgi:hypothetical protein